MSPDGRQVAWVGDRNGSPQVWVQDAEDSGTGRVVEFPHPAVAVHWSADGQWLACALATDGGVRQQVWVVRPDGTHRRHVAGSADRHAALGPWTRAGHRLVVTLAPVAAGEPTQAVVVDPATGETGPLAEGALISVLDLSADERFLLLRDGTRGAQFCVVVDRVADRDHPLLAYPATGSTDVGLLRRSPAGQEQPHIAYLVTDAGLPRRVLLAQPIGPDGRRGAAGVFAEREDAELEQLDSDEDGRLLLLVWNVAGASEVELLDTATRRRVPVGGLPGPVVTGSALSRDGSRLVLCVEGPERPRELWRVDVAAVLSAPGDGPAGAGGAPPAQRAVRPAPVTVSTLPPSGDLVHPTLHRFSSHDGLELSGWLYRPPGAHGPGPAMLSLHGGPEAQERPVFSAQHQAMVTAGITVFAPNVRGSSGFGRAFVHADDRLGRWDAIADVRSCVEYLTGHGLADPDRIAVTGRSYGGYLTLAALVAFPRTFAAGVDICGMSDLLHFYRESEPWIAAAAVSKYGDPVADRDLLRSLSPLPRAHRITAPLLVVHGELDTNVPVGEAHRIVAALRALDRPVSYLELAGEGHEYRRASSQLLLLQTMAAFLTRHLRVGPPARCGDGPALG
ncbi:peptidase S9 [Nakamurella endophytica]|uniref:Peptidase S9 n=2 Tax=Nakamurella endophytica TaxID=1748367 RepID=A0A917SRD5_9ACTN|nr:peptidase S9 [Nakamurella endophytica]